MLSITIILLMVLISYSISKIRKLKQAQHQKNKIIDSQLPLKTPSQNSRLDNNRNKYLSSISHELRTPLNVIMGYAQLLENQADEEDPNQEKLSLMRHNCEHLSHLIDGILEFSAIESGRLKVQSEWIDLTELIKQLTLMFTNQAQKKGLTFNAHISKELPSNVKTDHKRLQQVLINLLNNAIKFTEEGEVTLTIKYRNQVATFSIKDTGCGIKLTDIERIFTPFERIENPNKNIPGTGLGLPITQMLAELLGGELKVKSQIGQGSTFTFKLMLAPQTGYNQEPTRSQEVEELKKPLLNQSHRIIIVDDEASHRQLVKDILAPLSCHLSTANDAAKAQVLIADQTFDLAIIDVSMPGLNGWQLAEWINEKHPKTKVIMLSGNPRDTEQSGSVKYENYITKPINIRQFITQITQAIGLSWSQPTIKNNKNDNDIINLCKSDYSALQNMLEIGHVNGIKNHLDQMHQDRRITEAQFKQLKIPINNMNLNLFNQIINKHE